MCIISKQIAEYCAQPEELECSVCANVLTQHDTCDYKFECDQCNTDFLLNDFAELELIVI